MENNFEIMRASNFNDSSLPKKLEEISSIESAILYRTRDYFSQAIQENRLVLAVKRIKDSFNQIIWAGLILPLSEQWAELWSFYVDSNHRSHGICGTIIEELKILGNEQNKKLLLTMKPNISGSEWMILSATKHWFLPVSFNFLKNNIDAYNECCVCDDKEGSENCLYRDNECILWVNSDISWAKEASMEYINSPDFKEAIKRENIRAKVLNNISKILKI